ncbi:MAG TPA: von Willebrand factor type A domain-containing protein, partial [Nannocystaceae bacterium]|nr:von Willebrand factor type A domain-containing protein [Nannocystaceae bacterium]
EAVPLEVGRPAVDRPIWWSTAAAALVLGVPLAACHAVDPGVDYRDEETIASSRIYQYIHAPDPEEEEEPPPDDEAGGTGQRHKGEEGRMGKPTSKNKSGLYAMKGPRGAVPQMARSFDPEMASRSAGVLGTMSQGSGNYLASPYGGAYAVGNDDGDVWGGLSPQGSMGVGGLGLVGAGQAVGDERYAPIVERGWARVAQEPLSTFSIDVDTAAYANVRRMLRDGVLPPADAVRVEEMINYFDYAYPEPAGQHPLAVSAEVAAAPWNPEHRLVRVGMKALELDPAALPPRNLVFLIDTSGSMSWEGKLGLVVDGLKMLADDLRPVDRIAVVTYAGSSGVVLEPTPGSQREAIKGALSNLRAGGGTNGAAGIWLAYRLAHKHFQEGAINRVILATDGDFNVGVSGHDELIKVIERERETGVFLSVLAVGTGNLNDRTMEQIADHGNGNYSYLDSREEARKVLVEQSAGTLATVAKDVKIQVEFNPAKVAAYRLVGYENRALAAEDFNDDRKDAGELGVGHTVTALYEVVPVGKAVPGAIDPLRYQRPRAELVESDEMLTVKIRYKLPEAKSSVPFEVPVIDRGAGLGDASPQLRLATAIAGFGLSLRGSERLGEWGLDEAAALLDGVDVADPHGRIAELRELIQVARRLQGRNAAR